jgi:hypothetical protein
VVYKIKAPIRAVDAAPTAEQPEPADPGEAPCLIARVGTFFLVLPENPPKPQTLMTQLVGELRNDSRVTEVKPPSSTQSGVARHTYTRRMMIRPPPRFLLARIRCASPSSPIH